LALTEWRAPASGYAYDFGISDANAYRLATRLGVDVMSRARKR
jgi:hypothetical protein